MTPAARRPPYFAAQNGFVLLSVVLGITLIAVIAFVINNEAATQVTIAAGELQRDELRYVAEAGLAHAQWQFAQNNSCTGYTDLASTAFGNNSYDANITPNNGSPVTMTINATLASGTSLSRVGLVKAYAAPVSLTLQPDAEGKDTFIEGESGHRNHNKGDLDELKTSSLIGKEYRTLIQFDLSALPPAAVVQSAVLELNLQSFGSSDVVEAYRLISDWTEMGVTWNDYDGSNSWSSPGGDYDSDILASFLADSTGPKSMDITAVAGAWVDGTHPNYGLILLSPPNAGGNENKYFSSDKGNPLHPKLILTYACECGTSCSGTGASDNIVLSTDSAATLGGLSFDDIDFAEYDPIGDTATLRFEGALTTLISDIDALHILANGDLLLSTTDDATLGGLSFADGDLIEYDPWTDNATLYFDESAFSANEDIKSVYLMDNGHIVLSTESNATLGSLSFTDNDLAEYDPDIDTATLYFDGSAAALISDIDAVHLLDNGHIVLSTKDDANLGGLSFEDGDLVDYDPGTDTADLYFAEDLFAGNEDLISIHIGSGSAGATEPFAHWKLDEGTGPTAIDSVGGNDGTLNGDPTWTTGTIGGALDFDGSGDYVITDSNFTPPPIGTVSFWMKVPGSPASHGRILGLDNAWEIRHVTTGTPDGIPYGLVFDLGISGINTEFVTTTTIDSPGQWYHVAGAYDTSSDAYAVYVDGVPHKSGTFSSSLSVPAADLLSLGTRTGSTDYFDGTLDEVRVYDRFLSPSEIADLAAGGGGGSIFVTVAVGDDDAEQLTSDGTMLVDSSDLELADNLSGGQPTDIVGIRFANVAVPQGETIANARIQFQVDELDSGAASLTIEGEAVDDAAQFTSAAYNITSRPRTSASVLWSPPEWTAVGERGPDQRTVNLASVIQEIVDRSGWSSGNAMAFVISGSGVRTAEAFEGDPAGAPELYIEYGTACNETFADDFETDDYTGDTGTQSWQGFWLEVGESDGANSGDEQVVSFGGSFVGQVKDNNNGGEGLEREADLSAYTNARLTFKYWRVGLDNSSDYATLEVSDNGGSSWTEIDRFEGPANDSPGSPLTVNRNISSYNSANTRIRLLTSSNMGNNDAVYIDDVEIAVSGCGP